MSIPRKPFYVRAQGRESFPGKGTTMDTPDTSNAMPKVQGITARHLHGSSVRFMGRPPWASRGTQQKAGTSPLSLDDAARASGLFRPTVRRAMLAMDLDCLRWQRLR